MAQKAKLLTQWWHDDLMDDKQLVLAFWPSLSTTALRFL